MIMDTLNIVVVGDMQVGKTAYLITHVTGEFSKVHHHNPNTVYQLPFATNHGLLTTNITKGGNNLPLDQHIHGILLMFSLTDAQSFTHFIDIIHNLSAQYPDIPIVWLCNKVDCKDRMIQSEQVSLYLRRNFKTYHNVSYYDISAKSNYNFNRPFLYILRHYYADLKFVDFDPVEPPIVELHPSSWNNMSMELN